MSKTSTFQVRIVRDSEISFRKVRAGWYRVFLGPAEVGTVMSDAANGFYPWRAEFGRDGRTNAATTRREAAHWLAHTHLVDRVIAEAH